MAVLTSDQINDVLIGTLNDLGKLKFSQIAQDIQKYEVLGRLMKEHKVKFDSGDGIQRNLMVTTSGNARHVGLYEPDVTNVTDVLRQTNIPWRHLTTNYAFDRREKQMNSGGSRIVDVVQLRRTDAMIDLAKLMETAFWNKPADSSDELLPFGVPYWIVKNATTGFNGGAPSGFSAGAGGVLHDNWKNYTAQYTTVTKTDAIKKMRRAHRLIDFQSPVDIPDYRRGNGQQYRIYVNIDTIEGFEELGEAQNENLGRDLAAYDGTMSFRRHTIVYIPFLNDDSTDPIYFIDWSCFNPVFLRGEYLREEGPIRSPKQHTVKEVHIDLTYNYLCTDRRRQAVLSK